MKTTGIIITLAVLGSGAWLGYSTLSSRADSDEFITERLDRADIIQTVSATGTIEPITKVIVGSQVSGKIKKWYADFNQRVTEGFILAELDTDQFQSAFERAQAELELTKAKEEELLVRFKDAQREYKRIEALVTTHNASDNEVLVAQAGADAARAAWKGAQASVQSAKAALSAAKVDLDHTVIRSPIDGVVIARNIDLGQTVAASLQAPELFLIANNLSRMQVNANVSEADIGLIAEGRKATFRVDGFPLRVFEGNISQIRFNATILDGVVTYVTLIEANNDDLALRPGMTANVTIEVARATNVLRVPNAALRFSPKPPDPTSGGVMRAPENSVRKPTVYVLAGTAPKPVELNIGLSNGAFTQVVDGTLREGDSVIVERNWRRAAESGRRSDVTQSLRPPGR
jgi:HlyD family secretion protein